MGKIDKALKKFNSECSCYKRYSKHKYNCRYFLPFMGEKWQASWEDQQIKDIINTFGHRIQIVKLRKFIQQIKKSLTKKIMFNKSYTKKVDDQFIKMNPKPFYTYAERGFWLQKLLDLEMRKNKKKNNN